jgi:hypothetical protein
VAAISCVHVHGRAARRCNDNSANPNSGRKMSLQKMMPAFPGAKLWAAIIWYASLSRRKLVVKYEGRAAFWVEILQDWSEDRIMSLIRTPWSGEYPIWEMSSRVFGNPILVGQPSSVGVRPSWHFPDSAPAINSCRGCGTHRNLPHQ